MGITHVIRGDDHVNNTPRQINILQALGAPVPTYAHVSMILGDDGQKLSKRHGAVNVMEYEANGYLPEAIVNYLARLGLVARRRRGLLARAAGRVVRPRPHHAVGRAVQHRKAELAERPLHQGRGQRAPCRTGQKRFDERGVTVTASPSLEAIIGLYKERVGNERARRCRRGVLHRPASEGRDPRAAPHR